MDMKGTYLNRVKLQLPVNENLPLSEISPVPEKSVKVMENFPKPNAFNRKK
jgi:hypothetical protein